MEKFFENLNLKKEIVFEFDHLEVGGLVMIESWDDCLGFIEMRPFDVDLTWDEFSNLSRDQYIERLKDGINDGGFGCKEIIGADVWVKAVMVDDLGSEAKRYIDNNFIGVSRELTAEDIESMNEYMED